MVLRGSLRSAASSPSRDGAGDSCRMIGGGKLGAAMWMGLDAGDSCRGYGDVPVSISRRETFTGVVAQ
eukprot:1155575-Pyramimonas_sp.AAC.1